MQKYIKVIGAKDHNLKNIDVEIPKDKLVVVTGLSGSGKSTLAFHTLYAEGQRRYIESLSAYARQFLDKIDKPNVDKIEGLTPAIAIDQKTTSKNPRSTVGTITEIYDYFRLLFARVGEQFCHKCGDKITNMTTQDIIKEVKKLPDGTKAMVMASLVKEKKGSFTDLIERLRAQGYIRAMIDGVVVRLDEEIDLIKTKKHTIKLIIDRLVLNKENSTRIDDSVEKALKEGFGELEIDILNNEEVNLKQTHIHYSKNLACFNCKISFDELEPLGFSFNSPKGACPECNGLGIKYSIDLNKIIDDSLSIEQGAIKVLHGFNKSYYAKLLKAFCTSRDINTHTIYENLEEHQKKLLLNGDGENVSFFWKSHKIQKNFDGVIKTVYNMFKDEKNFNDFMIEKTCNVCEGNRLKEEFLSVQIAKKTISYMINSPIEDVYSFFDKDSNFKYFNKQQKLIAQPILKEIHARLYFLYNVGLGYLSLGRDARSISGGEAQRIRISSQIGSGLTGVMYVLDEPSIGLHERDTLKLIKTLQELRDRGNSVIVVEHDKETIKHADRIIDIGPGAGEFGGEVIFNGTYEDLKKAKTLTADYIFGRKKIQYKTTRKSQNNLTIKNVSINNINKLNVSIPLNVFTCITGVSGSGKSSLILQTLLPFAQQMLNHARKIRCIKGVEIEGLEHLDKVIYLDQSPIGRTPRSNPSTYIGLFDEIRNIFTQTKESKIRGYKPGRFSFNVKGGRCERCQGDGELKIEMHFLPDVVVKCDECQGSRYNNQTLEILYKGKNISQVLSMSVTEAIEFFQKHPRIMQRLETLSQVGLGYITLGQNATTLSGGEAQRIKLSKELSKKSTGKTLYILDEPTTGLHFHDTNRLMNVLHTLVEANNSVIVIEHNMDIIKNADYIIDMGPDGGSKGGMIVDMGTPKELASRHKKTKSYTGKFLEIQLKEDD
jgi:excinuclease ABC subunit A